MKCAHNFNHSNEWIDIIKVEWDRYNMGGGGLGRKSFFKILTCMLKYIYGVNGYFLLDQARPIATLKFIPLHLASNFPWAILSIIIIDGKKWRFLLNLHDQYNE